MTGKIVMQVEELVEHNSSFIPVPPPPWVKTREEAQKWRDDEQALFELGWKKMRTEWRDATLSDLTDGKTFTRASA